MSNIATQFLASFVLFAAVAFSVSLAIGDEDPLPVPGGCTNIQNMCGGFAPCPVGNCVLDGTVQGSGCWCTSMNGPQCRCYVF